MGTVGDGDKHPSPCSSLYPTIQSVLNAAAKLIYNGRMDNRILPLLSHLQRRPAPERIKFRLAVLTWYYRHLHTKRLTIGTYGQGSGAFRVSIVS